jgi:hypothetical protein
MVPSIGNLSERERPMIDRTYDLGRLVSSHRRSLTYLIIISGVALVTVWAALALAAAGDVAAGGGIAGAVLAAWTLYLWARSRNRLFLHENGLRLIRKGQERVLLWSDLEKVRVDFSHYDSPDTIINIDFRQHTGRRVVLDMNWTRRKQMARDLWPLLQEQDRPPLGELSPPS